jgi:hypothetical protein
VATRANLRVNEADIHRLETLEIVPEGGRPVLGPPPGRISWTHDL